jgi:hypothetical protein
VEVPVTDLLPASELASLGEALARAEAEGRAVTFVYAPTVHHHAAEPAPGSRVVVVQPAAASSRYPAPFRSERAAPHPGIDVDLTGGPGGGFALPVNVRPLPEVPESRSWAPMVLLVSGWSGLGGMFAAALTQSPFAIAYVAVALVVSAVAFSEVYRKNL